MSNCWNATPLRSGEVRCKLVASCGDCGSSPRLRGLSIKCGGAILHAHSKCWGLTFNLGHGASIKTPNRSGTMGCLQSACSSFPRLSLEPSRLRFGSHPGFGPKILTDTLLIGGLFVIASPALCRVKQSRACCQHWIASSPSPPRSDEAGQSSRLCAFASDFSLNELRAAKRIEENRRNDFSVRIEEPTSEERFKVFSGNAARICGIEV